MRQKAVMTLSSWMNAGNTGAPESLYANVAGNRMHYQKCGRGAPLLLLHGMLGYCFSWRFNMSQLGETATVYAPDMLNMGHSDRVPGLDASLSATAERVFAFMDAVGLEQVDLLGTSHGGALAIWMAASRPERVRRLILVAPANPFSSECEPLIAFYQSPWGRWIAPRVPFLPRAVQEIALGRMYGNAERVANGTLDSYMEPLRIPGTAEHVLNLIAAWHSDMADLRKRLYDLPHVPVLLLWGDRDRAVGLKSCALLRKYMPVSRLVVLRGAGHLPYEEQPTEFNAAIVEFLSRTEYVPGILVRWPERESSAA
jgi:pimeloyl-ACP methyl ester carboxylesterase